MGGFPARMRGEGAELGRGGFGNGGFLERGSPGVRGASPRGFAPVVVVCLVPRMRGEGAELGRGGFGNGDFLERGSPGVRGASPRGFAPVVVVCLVPRRLLFLCMICTGGTCTIY